MAFPPPTYFTTAALKVSRRTESLMTLAHRGEWEIITSAGVGVNVLKLLLITKSSRKGA